MKAAAWPFPEQEPVMYRLHLAFNLFIQLFLSAGDNGPNIDPLGGTTSDEGPYIDPWG
jgi:hypothetical protein